MKTSKEQWKKIKQSYLKSRNKSWSSSTQKIQQTDFQDNARATKRTAPIVNYQESQNKKYLMNSSKKHDYPPT